MVDFDKLRKQGPKTVTIDPRDIFRRLPKPEGINDLYTSQSEVLTSWFENRKQRDMVIKLHTGGGKTLVGLLMCQSSLNETQEPVLYLVPNKQLVKQTLERARKCGVPAVEYNGRLPDDFVNCKTVLVATYSALFHGYRNKFGLRGGAHIQQVGTIVLDDAHVAFSVVRDSFTIEITTEGDQDQYATLVGEFRHAFEQAGLIGTFDDIVTGKEPTVLEVPYWAWREKRDVVRGCVKQDADRHKFAWPLIRDHLHMCHLLVSRRAFTISPMLPFVDMLPTFTNASRRIYMSATIADDSEIIRTFDAAQGQVAKALTSRSVAGISERMILVPGLMSFGFDSKADSTNLMKWVAEKMDGGVVILTPSNEAAKEWEGIAEVAAGPEQVDQQVERLQSGETFGPVAFANRYDGIDLPGDACRLLVMWGLPRGTSSYDQFRASALYGGKSMTRLLAQRVEQGIGRGARGSGDYCIVLLLGADLTSWVAQEVNYRFLTAATRAQLDMGIDISEAVKSTKELSQTIEGSLTRDPAWTKYHAEELAEALDDDAGEAQQLEQAATERRALHAWAGGRHQQAIERIEAFLADDGNATSLDRQSRGWLLQMAARIADDWGQHERADDLQRQAFAENGNLVRSKSPPPYVQLKEPGQQERAIVALMPSQRMRRGHLSQFEDIVSRLVPVASSNQFEQSLMELGQMLGFSAQRFDKQGIGPDVLWLLPGDNAIVFEAKSRKKGHTAFRKDDHGQLLVADNWFSQSYPHHSHVAVSVCPTDKATAAAMAECSDSRVLTYGNLDRLVADARALITGLVTSGLDDASLVNQCARLLTESKVRADQIAQNYLVPFVKST